MKLNNIRLMVKDFDACFAFYNDTLGLTCTWGKPGDNFASFDIGIPSGLAIFKANLMNEATNQANVTLHENEEDKFSIIVEVESVDDTFDLLRNKNVTFLNEPKDMAAWGIRVAHFRDPENNLIEIFSPLPKDKWAEHLIEDEKKFKR